MACYSLKMLNLSCGLKECRNAHFNAINLVICEKLLENRQNNLHVKAVTPAQELTNEWYRPNVQDAASLRKKFDYIIAHVRSFRDGKEQLPEGVSVFDLYEKK